MNYKYVDIYLYDPITKEFMAKGKSDKNPLDPETPIIPACATTVDQALKFSTNAGKDPAVFSQLSNN